MYDSPTPRNDLGGKYPGDPWSLSVVGMHQRVVGMEVCFSRSCQCEAWSVAPNHGPLRIHSLGKQNHIAPLKSPDRMVGGLYCLRAFPSSTSDQRAEANLSCLEGVAEQHFYPGGSKNNSPYNIIWKFPEIEVPPNHSLNGIFPHNSSILGYLHFRKPLYCR